METRKASQHNYINKHAMDIRETIFFSLQNNDFIFGALFPDNDRDKL